MKLDEAELKALEDPSRPHRIPGRDFMGRNSDRERPWTTCTRIDWCRPDRAGRDDKIFPTAGAETYKPDPKPLEYHHLDTGHFAPETNGDEIAGLIREFHGEHLARQ
jgi:pimeloyl-ACP methyl ester carboxylesterase